MSARTRWLASLELALVDQIRPSWWQAVGLVGEGAARLTNAQALSTVTPWCAQRIVTKSTALELPRKAAGVTGSVGKSALAAVRGQGSAT